MNTTMIDMTTDGWTIVYTVFHAGMQTVGGFWKFTSYCSLKPYGRAWGK